MSGSGTLDQLVDALGSPDGSIHEQAQSRLESMGIEAVEPLIRSMFSDNMGKAWRAAQVLSKIDDPRRLEPMRHALLSRNSLVGQVAVQTLETAAHAGQSRSQTVEAFIHALPEARFLVQIHIIAALERLGDKEAIAPLIDRLQTADSPELRYTIIQALGTLGATQALDLIRSFAQDENHHVQERVKIAERRLASLQGDSGESKSTP